MSRYRTSWSQIQEQMNEFALSHTVRYRDPLNKKRFAVPFKTAEKAKAKMDQLKRDGVKEIEITKDTLRGKFKEDVEIQESDAYDNNRYMMKRYMGQILARPDNSNTKDGKDHVYAPNAKIAKQLYSQGKKVYREETILEDGHDDVSSSKRMAQVIGEDAQLILQELNKKSNEESLPTWWTNKLATSAHNMNAARDYISNDIKESSDGYIVKFANSKGAKIASAWYKDEESAKKALEAIRKNGGNGIISKGKMNEELEESAAAREIDRTNTRKDSMDYQMYKKSAELLRKKDYKALGKHIYKADTAPKEYVMNVISKKEPNTFKKIYGNQSGYLSLMKPLNMSEQLEEAMSGAQLKQVRESKQKPYVSMSSGGQYNVLDKDGKTAYSTKDKTLAYTYFKKNYDNLKEAMSDAQLKKVRDSYKDLKTISPEKVKTLRNFLDRYSTDSLMQLAQANINFVSTMARSVMNKRKMGDPKHAGSMKEEKTDSERIADLRTKQMMLQTKVRDMDPNKDKTDIEIARNKLDNIQLKMDKIKSKNEEVHPAKALIEAIKAVKNKAEKTGMPYSILKKVYDRGMAAWKGGHRPGTTSQQWALARVNSFVTKSKGTWGGADSDLAKKVRSKD